MSGTIDRKVVEMEFDNQRFEQNVATSLSTIDKLKKSLNFDESSKSLTSLERTANGIDLSNLGNAAEAVSVKFSAMRVVAMTALQNITNSAINAGKKIVSSIYQGGVNRALNIEQAKFQIEGLGYAWSDLEKQINYGVKDTAYGLDAAAKVASQLLASGVEFKKNFNPDTDTDQMSRTLRAISGVAAMTNGTYEDMGRIFTTVAGNGRLMTEQLMQFSGRGLNVAASLRDYFNSSSKRIDEFYKKYTETAKKSNDSIQKGAKATEANIRTMVTNGAIDFDTFAAAMDEAFGKHAKEANKTFTGSLSNVKAALSRVGAKFATPGLENLRDIFNALIPVIDNINKSLDPFVDKVSNGMKTISSMAGSILNYIDARQKIKELNIDTNITKFGNIDTNQRAVIEWNDKNLAKYKKQLSSWEDASSSWEDIQKKFKGSKSTILGMTGGYENFQVAFSPLLQTDKGAVLLSQKTVDDYMFSLIKKAGKNAKAEDIIKLDAKGIMVNGTLVKGLIADIGNNAERTSEIMHYLGEDGYLNGSIKEINELAEKLLISKENANKIREAFDGLISTIGKAKNKLSNLLFDNREDRRSTKAIDKYKTALNNIISTLLNLGSVVKSIFKAIAPGENEISKFFRGAQNGLVVISSFLLSISEKLKNFINESSRLKNIQDAFKGLRSAISILKNGIVLLFNAIKPNNEVMSDWGETVKSLFDKILNAVGTIGRFITKIDEAVKSSKTITDTLGKVNEVINKIFSDDNDKKLGKTGKFIDGIKGPLKGIATILATVISSAWSIVESAIPFLLQGIDKLKEGIVTVIEAAKDAFSNSDNSKAMDLVNAGLFGGLLYQARYLVNTLTGFFKQFKPQFSLAFNEMKDSLIAYQKEVKAKIIWNIAKSVALLAVSCLILSGIDGDSIASSLGAIAGALTELVGAMYFLNKTQTFKNTTNPFKQIAETYNASTMGNQLLKMAGAVLILSAAVKVFADMDPDSLAQGVEAVGVVIAELTGYLYLLKKIDIDRRAVPNLLTLSISLLVLAKVVKMIGEMKPEAATQGVVAIVGLLTGINLFLATLKKTKVDKETIPNLIGIAAAIAVLGLVVKVIGSMKPEAATQGVMAIVGLLIGINLFLATLKKTKVDKEAIPNLMGIAASIAVLGLVVKVIGSMEPDAAKQGVEAIAGILISLSAFMYAMKMIKVDNDTIPKLLGISAAVLVLGIVVKMIGSMDPKAAEQGVIALYALLFAIAAFCGIMQKVIESGDISLQLLTIAAAIGVMALSLKILGSMSLAEIGKGLLALAGGLAIILIAGAVAESVAAGLGVLAGVFMAIGAGVLLVGLGLVAAGAGITAISVGIYALCAAVAFGSEVIIRACVAILTSIASFIPVLIQKLGEGLILFLQVVVQYYPLIGEVVKGLILTLLSVATECIPQVVEGLLKLIISLLDMLIQHGPEIVERIFEFLIAIINALAAKIPDLIQAAVNLLMSFFEGVVSALKSIDPEILIKGIAGVGLLTALMLALAAVAAITPLAMVGVLGIGAVLLELIAVIAAIGAISQLPGLKWLISEGGEMLGLVGQAIGKFVGGFVAGFADMMIGQLVAMAVELSMFMVALQPFLAGVKMVDASSFDGMKALADVILMLTAANIIDGLTKWFTGGTSLAKFGEELANFAPYFKQYYDHIKGIDGSVVEASANAAKTLSEMANNLPKEGGVVSWFEGENSLITFAEGLANFGPAMKSYAASVSGLSIDDINISVAAAKAISEMAAGLPNQGGVKSWFEGDNTLTDIAEGLAAFGPALATYTTSVAGLDLDSVTTSVEVAKMISEMAANLPNQGGISSWFEGDNTLSTIAEELVAFGPALVDYADSVKDLNPEQVAGAMDIAKSLVELISAMPNLGGTDSWTNGDQSLEKLGEELYYFGPYLKAYSDSISGISVATVNNSFSILKTAFEVLQDIPDLEEGKLETIGEELSKFGPAIKGYVDSISEIDTSKLDAFGDQFSKSAQSGINQFVSTFSESNAKVSNSATKIISTFSKGITDGKDKVTGSMKTIASSALNALSRYVSDHYDNIYGYGKYCVEGFANGINDYTYLAEAKSRVMAENALKAAKKALDEKSPSKKFYKVGAFAGIALVNAFSDFGRKVYNASYNMADYANKGLGKAIQKISDLVDGNLDLQPVISPIIDLDNVRASARTLNGLLDTPTLALTTRIGMINTDMNGRQTDLSNKDVVRAIDGLRSDIRNRPQYVTNVNGVTYDGTSDVATAVEDLANAIKVGRRV